MPSPQLDNLTQEVAENTEVIGSAIQLLNNLSALLEAAKNDPVAIQALADTLNTQSNSLADAIVANTPADPNAPPPVE
jgi:hypothetical protein